MAGAGRKEINFEATIERDLLEHAGYLKGSAADFDPVLALTAKDFFAFVEASQPTLWAQLGKEHGAGREQGVLDALAKNLSTRGTLEVLRHGFKFFGKLIQAAFFRPAHGMNPDLDAQCALNRVVVTRQVKFNPAGEDSVDMLVSVNGLPIATLELKNPLSGQNVEHARKQYQNRDPKLPLFGFKTRALVHFAVDPDEISMATRLAGRATQFLPFNKGCDGGKGNPPVECVGYRTGYLWREVLTRDSLLDLLARFIHVLVDEEIVDGKKITKETLVFPRYHQLDVVRRLVDAARDDGPGKSYLVQHSAGSGKSNSIAWVAHRLASLHDANDRKVFDSVVVVTDRRILDRQLQDTIYQFEHKQGVVERIDRDSAQLAKALERGTPIVITTLQKFPFVSEKVGSLPDRRYAVIVDEAHSSQSGEAADKLRQVLAAPKDGEEPEEPTYEDEIAKVMASRGPQKNLSFFGFTATPKAKTLELFGRPGPSGKPAPFHLYSMRQAIEEGFILDVLRNYTTYRAYYKLVQAAAGSDPDVKKREATAALARFMSLHPHNIAQKTEVIVEHFRGIVRRKLNGKAKALVVTRSRLHAVRFKQAFDEYVKEKGYTDLRSLVAFSGTVKDPDTEQEWTEVGMNGGLAETEVPRRLKSADYQVLIAANKYQTGFDEPLLCAMYVDKRLAGVQAVQTLSRLNRMCQGKAETFVLDFVNEAEEIRQSFQPYYEQTTVSETADPFQLEKLRHTLDEAQVWHASEIEAFAKVFYRPKEKLTDTESEELYRHLDPARDRWLAMEDVDAREKWRGSLDAYVRLYAFLCQVMPWTDRDLETRASFGRYLLKRLPPGARDVVKLEGEVDLHSYRLAKLAETDIELEKSAPRGLKGITAVGTRKAKDDKVPLHEIIEVLNERFGTNFTAADQLVFEQVVIEGKSDEQVRSQAHANSYENFALAIRNKIEGLMIDRMDRNQEIVTRFLNEEGFNKTVSELLAKRIYEELRKAGA